MAKSSRRQTLSLQIGTKTASCRASWREAETGLNKRKSSLKTSWRWIGLRPRVDSVRVRQPTVIDRRLACCRNKRYRNQVHQTSRWEWFQRRMHHLNWNCPPGRSIAILSLEMSAWTRATSTTTMAMSCTSASSLERTLRDREMFRHLSWLSKAPTPKIWGTPCCSPSRRLTMWSLKWTLSWNFHRSSNW